MYTSKKIQQFECTLQKKFQQFECTHQKATVYVANSKKNIIPSMMPVKKPFTRKPLCTLQTVKRTYIYNPKYDASEETLLCSECRGSREFPVVFLHLLLLSRKCKDRANGGQDLFGHRSGSSVLLLLQCRELRRQLCGNQC